AELGIPYDSEEGLALADRIASTLAAEAHVASAELADERSPFPAWDWGGRGDGEGGGSGTGGGAGPPLRNAQLTSIAPTGSISIIAGTTAGIEPLFAVSFARNILDTELVETSAAFERIAREGGFHSPELTAEIARTGSVADATGVPDQIRRAFVTAAELAPRWHLRMQAAFQRHVDGAVSKTVNLPSEATVDDVAAIYTDAWRQGVKGVTVYRYGSRPGQVLTRLGAQDGEAAVRVDTEYAGGCLVRPCEV
ncbi:MAG TPA: hypothetical protein VFZ41_10180, partial [Solirubrobacterales bacterium]